MRSKCANDDELVLKVGCVMWLIDQSVRRNENKMARVTEVIPGADGIIQSALIKSADEVFWRPVVKLAPFMRVFEVKTAPAMLAPEALKTLKLETRQT